MGSSFSRPIRSGSDLTSFSMRACCGCDEEVEVPGRLLSWARGEEKREVRWEEVAGLWEPEARLSRRASVLVLVSFEGEESVGASSSAAAAAAAAAGL